MNGPAALPYGRATATVGLLPRSGYCAGLVLTSSMPYTPAFIDHLENPRNAGELPDANAIGEATNPVCGDRMRISLRVQGGRIEAAQFLAYGCPPTLVSGSALTELIEGKTVEEAMNLTRKALLEVLGGLPSRKQHAAALAIETLRIALESGCGDLLDKS